jgi:hypothetical protein
MDNTQIKDLSNQDLILRLGRLFEQERKLSHLILLYLREVKARRLYADYGFPSLFEMLVHDFRLSESAAYQRLKAVELLEDVPQVEQSLVNGELNLSTLAQAQRQIRHQEKILERKLAPEVKLEIVESIMNKTQAEAEKELVRLLPEAAALPCTEVRRTGVDTTRLVLDVPNQLMDGLKRLQEIWAHVNPSMDFLEVIERSVGQSLKAEDPALKESGRRKTNELPGSKNVEVVKTENRAKASEPLTHHFAESAKRCATGKRIYISVQIKQGLWQRAQSQCEFISPLTSKRCACRFGLEKEHVIPIAKGGTNDLANLQLLCKAHNLLRARRHFGRQNIEEKILARGIR